MFITKLESEGTGDWEFGSLFAIAVAPDGSVYITDDNNIRKFRSNGALITKWGEAGASAGQFDLATGIAVASDGSVYVSDMLNNRIQKFLPEK